MDETHGTTSLLASIPSELLCLITNFLELRDVGLLTLCTKSFNLEFLLSKSRLQTALYLKENKYSLSDAVIQSIIGNNISLYTNLIKEGTPKTLHAVAQKYLGIDIPLIQNDKIREYKVPAKTYDDLHDKFESFCNRFEGVESSNIPKRLQSHPQITKSSNPIISDWMINGLETYIQYFIDVHCLSVKETGICALEYKDNPKQYSWIHWFLSTVSNVWTLNSSRYPFNGHYSNKEFAEIVQLNQHGESCGILSCNSWSSPLETKESIIVDHDFLYFDKYDDSAYDPEHVDLAIEYDSYNIVNESMISTAIKLSHTKLLDMYTKYCEFHSIHHNICERYKAIKLGIQQPKVIPFCSLCDRNRLPSKAEVVDWCREKCN